MTGKRKSNRTYLSELYALTEKLKAEGKSDEAAKVLDTELKKNEKRFQRMLKDVVGCAFSLDPQSVELLKKEGMPAFLDYIYTKDMIPKEHYTVYMEIVKRGADPLDYFYAKDLKGFKELIQKASPEEFERLARMEIEEVKKLTELSMQNSLGTLAKVDPEGYEIYQKKGAPGLMEHFVARGTMTKDEYDSWKKAREKAVEEFNRIMKLYLKEVKNNPEFREQEMKDFEP